MLAGLVIVSGVSLSGAGCAGLGGGGTAGDGADVWAEVVGVVCQGPQLLRHVKVTLFSRHPGEKIELRKRRDKGMLVVYRIPTTASY